MGVADPETLQATARTSATLSIMGSCGVIFLYIRQKWWNKSTHHNILFWMSVADTFYSLMMLIGTASFDSSFFCNLQGFVLNLTALATQCWCSIVGINLLLQMQFYWTDEKCRGILKWWHVGVVTYSLLPTVIAAGVSGFEPAGMWCWIPSSYPGLRMGNFYVCMWILFTINIGVIVCIHRRLYQLLDAISEFDPEGTETKKRYKWVVKQTILFVIVGMAIWIPGTVTRIAQVANPDGKMPEGLIFVQVLFTPAQGVFNFLLYTAPTLIRTCLNSKDGTTRSDSTLFSAEIPAKGPAVYAVFDRPDFTIHHSNSQQNPHAKRTERIKSPSKTADGKSAEVELVEIETAKQPEAQVTEEKPADEQPAEARTETATV